MNSYNKSILNAPKNKFLTPVLKPTPFSLQGEEEDSSESEEETYELKCSELDLSSDSSLFSNNEEKEDKKEDQLINEQEKRRISKVSGCSLETRGSYDSISL